jgi:tellurite resistance protein TerC
MSWVLFNIFILAMIVIDLFAHKEQKMGIKQALIWSGFWIGLAFAFNILIYFTHGPQSALEFLSGYLIEESLSLDNLFIFLLIFDHFKTPQEHLHRVLFWGVLGAIVMRALFIFGGIALVSQFHWLFYIFGVFLLYMGVQMFFKKEKNIHLGNNRLFLFIKKYLPMTEDYRNDHFFVYENSRWYATPLFVVLIAVEAADIVFAIDSIPAILAITVDPFIVYTSNIFAILGLRSLFFALSAFLKLLHYLHYALGSILAFVGLKMLIAPWVKVPITVTLAFIVCSIAITALLSIYYPKLDEEEGDITIPKEK